MKKSGPRPVGKEAKLAGQHLNEALRRAGYTREALAELLEVSKQQVDKYLSGKNRIAFDQLVVASRVLNVPLEFFVWGSDLAKAPYFIYPRRKYELVGKFSRVDAVMEPSEIDELMQKHWLF